MKTYKSKIGLELAIPLAVIFGWMLYNGAHSKKASMVLIAIVAIAFIVHMFSTTGYTVDKDSLRIKCGFFIDKSIIISGIQKISETYNPLSSPAASLDRLRITYRGGEILISPREKRDFINDLTRINPDIVVEYRNKN
ncbi:PH domain-containing protein [Flavobacterium sp. KBS0721]|uniref:PH domain-containing protein n=1 Tax=Flavobacterium sp. KBS0721 TaxID=1179672 RepID=UPI00098F0367|nr:PH domain-containing protein [Flavobacterium sp. KBS0721]QDW21055.1 hypothetical protein B0M43_0013315 [Flavobacterium sp. KBS0721]